MPDALTPTSGLLTAKGRIVVVEDLYGVPRACVECGGPIVPRRLDYFRGETDRDAGLRMDVTVPYCEACRLTMVPKGLTLMAQLAAGWKARA